MARFVIVNSCVSVASGQPQGLDDFRKPTCLLGTQPRYLDTQLPK